LAAEPAVKEGPPALAAVPAGELPALAAVQEFAVQEKALPASAVSADYLNLPFSA